MTDGRDGTIYARRREGATIKELARDFGLSEEEVFAITGREQRKAMDAERDGRASTDIAILLAALRSARETYDGQAPLPEKNGAQQALIAVVDYLEEMSVPADLLAPLNAVIFAFGDSVLGQQSPLLQIHAVGHRPPEPIQDRLAKASAAIALDLLIQAGLTQKAAAEEVALSVRKWSLPSIGSASVKWTTVRSWRNRLKSGSTDDADVRSYRSLERELSADNVDRAATARALLKNPYSVHPGARNRAKPPA